MKRGLNIQLNFTNRFIYTFIALTTLIIVGAGVFAFGTAVPGNFGHSAGELDLSTGVNGDALFNGGVTIAGILTANSNAVFTGGISSPQYCDENGANCKTITELAGSGATGPQGGSCKNILDLGLSTGSGIYTISKGGIIMDVFCDMATDDGGWTQCMNDYFYDTSQGGPVGEGIGEDPSFLDVTPSTNPQTDIYDFCSKSNGVQYLPNQEFLVKYQSDTGSNRYVIKVLIDTVTEDIGVQKGFQVSGHIVTDLTSNFPITTAFNTNGYFLRRTWDSDFQNQCGESRLYPSNWYSTKTTYDVGGCANRNSQLGLLGHDGFTFTTCANSLWCYFTNGALYGGGESLVEKGNKVEVYYR